MVVLSTECLSKAALQLYIPWSTACSVPNLYCTSVHGCLADICYSVWKSLYMTGTCLKWAFSPTHYCSISIMCCSHLCIVGVSGVTSVLFEHSTMRIYITDTMHTHTHTHVIYTRIHVSCFLVMDFGVILTTGPY